MRGQASQPCFPIFALGLGARSTGLGKTAGGESSGTGGASSAAGAGKGRGEKQEVTHKSASPQSPMAGLPSVLARVCFHLPFSPTSTSRR